MALNLLIAPNTDLEQQIKVAVENGYSVQEIVECLEAVASKCEFMAQDMRECPELYSEMGGD